MLATKILEKKPCRLDSLLNLNYLINAFNNDGKFVFVQFRNNITTGISIISVINLAKKQIFIDLFCTSLLCEKEKLRCGSNLMNFIKIYFCSQKYCYIKLFSLDEAETFYEKMGFKKKHCYFIFENGSLEGGWVGFKNKFFEIS